MWPSISFNHLYQLLLIWIIIILRVMQNENCLPSFSFSIRTFLSATISSVLVSRARSVSRKSNFVYHKIVLCFSPKNFIIQPKRPSIYKNIWAALREKVPNVLSRCHWYDTDFSKKKSKNLKNSKNLKSRCHTMTVIVLWSMRFSFRREIILFPVEFLAEIRVPPCIISPRDSLILRMRFPPILLFIFINGWLGANLPKCYW